MHVLFSHNPMHGYQILLQRQLQLNNYQCCDRMCTPCTHYTPSMVDSSRCDKSLDMYAVHTEASCHKAAHTHAPNPVGNGKQSHILDVQMYIHVVYIETGECTTTPQRLWASAEKRANNLHYYDTLYYSNAESADCAIGREAAAYSIHVHACNVQN